MADVIWKYPLPKERQFTLQLPEQAIVLSVQMQGDVPTLWAKVNPEFKLIAWAFDWLATGQEIPPNGFLGRYLGTVQTGLWEFHLFGEQVGP